MTGEYYTRKEKELSPFQPPLPSTPHRDDQNSMTASLSANESPSKTGSQKDRKVDRSESPIPIVSHMTSFQFAPTPVISTTRAPTMEIKIGDIHSIPMQISQGKDRNGKGGDEKEEIGSKTSSNTKAILSSDKSNTTKLQQEDAEDAEDVQKKKSKKEHQLYSKPVVEMDVKTRSKKRRVQNKTVKVIPSLAQIERVTGKTKKGLPACFVGIEKWVSNG